MKNSTKFEKDVLEIIKRIPAGNVTTYSEIVKAVGRPRAVRAAGNALNKNANAPIVPCHRVVKSNGNIGGYAGGVKEKIRLLHDEGVEVKNNKVVDFDKVLYKF
ncbi:MGMT family protein [Candidatus Parcubacteria bacterium]|nr:MGMT family protein [Candidatus Parcubacteria bacterium]